MVEEIDYTKNNDEFDYLAENDYHAMYIFKTSLLDTIDSLTLHFAVTFY